MVVKTVIPLVHNRISQGRRRVPARNIPGRPTADTAANIAPVIDTTCFGVIIQTQFNFWIGAAANMDILADIVIKNKFGCRCLYINAVGTGLHAKDQTSSD